MGDGVVYWGRNFPGGREDEQIFGWLGGFLPTPTPLPPIPPVGKSLNPDIKILWGAFFSLNLFHVRCASQKDIKMCCCNSSIYMSDGQLSH